MWVRHLRLGMGIFFASLAVLLFFREALAPELNAKFRNANLTLGAWLALVLAGWNAARWYMEWSAHRQRAADANPLAVRTIEKRPRGETEEPNLDFDFSGPAPGPSANGDHKG